jgi:predicted DNA-binding transcriptional regulator YafY
MNRIERISAILIQLQSKNCITAQEIADRFGISLRTVYRDMRSLEESGVPLFGEAGVGYSLVEGYKLPPVQFTIEEATAFLTAEKLVEKFTDRSMKEGYKSAMYKVKAVMRKSDKIYLETIDDNIQVLTTCNKAEVKEGQDYLYLIFRAIADKRIMLLHYVGLSDLKLSIRNIEPVGVYLQSGKWYIIAFCQLRKDYRTFRIDRIKDLLIKETLFQKTHPTLKKFLKEISHKEKLHTAVIRFDNDIIPYLGDQKYYNGFVSEVVGKAHTEIKFLTSSLEGIMRWYIMVADRAQIISPPELLERTRSFINALSLSLDK